MALFINPYNFIPLSKTPKKGDLVADTGEELLTGAITYTLTTGSSLFIPNVSSDMAFRYVHTKNEEGKDDDPDNEHKLQDFFSYTTLQEGETYDDSFSSPVIPGSEMRGMIRSIYEMLTNSCLSKINEDVVISKRTAEQFLPGIMEWVNDQVVLFEADCAIYRNNQNFQEHKKLPQGVRDGSAVYFKQKRLEKRWIKPDVTEMSADKPTNKNGWLFGYVMKGEDGPELSKNRTSNCEECVMERNYNCDGTRCWQKEKHCVHVLTKKGNQGKSYDISDIDVERLGFVIKAYQDDKVSLYKEYQSSYDDFIKKRVKAIPVYYSIICAHEKNRKGLLQEENNIMLSPACITKEVYRNSVKDSMKDYHGCRPIREKESGLVCGICPACSLFGLITKGGFSKAGNIRFTDLELVDKDGVYKNSKYRNCYDTELRVLPPLSSPKLSNTEFYLQKPKDPDGEVWFWTYDYYTVKRSDGSVELKLWSDQQRPVIAGRKFYWHGKTVPSYKHKTGLNKTVRTVRSGITFKGKLYFDGITEKQLEQLLFILRYTSDEKHGFKIGSGKSIGLGTVHFDVKQTDVRKFKDGYQVKTYKSKFNGWKDLGFDETVENAFSCITQILEEKDKALVHYPGVLAEGDEGFAWFVNNRNARRLMSYSPDETRVSEAIDSYPRKRIQIKLEQSLPTIMGNVKLSENSVIQRGNVRGVQNETVHRKRNSENQSSMVGVVKKYFADRGYGFIRIKNEQDCYFRCSAVKSDKDKIKEGCRVKFERCKKSDGKCYARNIEIIE